MSLGQVRRSIVSLSPFSSADVLFNSLAYGLSIVVGKGLVIGYAYDVCIGPPSPNVTLDYNLQYEVLAPPQSMRSVDSTIDGPFCYIYV